MKWRNVGIEVVHLRHTDGDRSGEGGAEVVDGWPVLPVGLPMVIYATTSLME
jgi:hypothetical protein